MKHISLFLALVAILTMAASTQYALPPDVKTYRQREYVTITNAANDTTYFREYMESNYRASLFVESDRTSGTTAFSVIVQTRPTSTDFPFVPVDTLTFVNADSVSTKRLDLGTLDGYEYRVIVDGSGTQVTEVNWAIVAKFQ